MRMRIFAMVAALVACVIVAGYAADYRESTTNGQMTTWRRAANITISNPADGVPSIVFYEEDKIRLPNGSLMSGPGVRDPQIKADLKDPLTEFPLINPATGEVIGVARYQDLYVVLYSLYLHLAAKRDESISPVTRSEPTFEGTN